MSRGQHGALDDKNVGPGLLHQLGSLLGPGGHGGYDAGHTRGPDRLDPFADQLWFHRLAVSLFEDGVHRSLVRLGDLLDDGRGIFVAGVHAVEIEDGHASQLAHRDGEVDVDHTVHGRTPEREREGEPLAHRKSDVDFVWIERYATRHQRDFVEAIRAAGTAPDPDLEAGLLPGSCFSGFHPALIQGVFTPLEWGGFGEL